MKISEEKMGVPEEQGTKKICYIEKSYQLRYKVQMLFHAGGKKAIPV